jgi:subtilisin family serine protease
LPSGSGAPTRGVIGRLGQTRTATRHILVQLHPRASERQFLLEAQARGLRQLGRVYGTNWLTMAVPRGADPAQAAAAAHALPGVLRATLDPIVSINQQIAPRDPLYKDDDDPSTKPCDPFFEICDPMTLVDQWGLFKVEAENAWRVTTGSPNVVIAILDSGVALNHDDLQANIWTNPGETAGNGIDDDASGLVDDVHGANFVGSNVGNPSDDPASQDGNPDIPMGGSWVSDPTAPFGIRFAGNPAVGDGLDNDGDGNVLRGSLRGDGVADLLTVDRGDDPAVVLAQEGALHLADLRRSVELRVEDVDGVAELLGLRLDARDRRLDRAVVGHLDEERQLELLLVRQMQDLPAADVDGGGARTGRGGAVAGGAACRCAGRHDGQQADRRDGAQAALDGCAVHDPVHRSVLARYAAPRRWTSSR